MTNSKIPWLSMHFQAIFKFPDFPDIPEKWEPCHQWKIQNNLILNLWYGWSLISEKFKTNLSCFEPVITIISEKFKTNLSDLRMTCFIFGLLQLQFQTPLCILHCSKCDLRILQRLVQTHEIFIDWRVGGHTSAIQNTGTIRNLFTVGKLGEIL